MDFLEFKQIFQTNLNQLIAQQSTLFVTDVSKDDLWAAYLEGFPEEDGIRQSFNCNCCRQFIKNNGNIVAVKNNTVLSIWNFYVEDPIYQKVVDRLRILVEAAPIRDVFITRHSKLGTDFNFETSSLKWDHLFFNLPSKFVTRGVYSEDSERSEQRQTQEVFSRALQELTIEATETVLDLINQNSLYRGEESRPMLEQFLKHQRIYKDLNDRQKQIYPWANFKQVGAVARIRNTAIGTLLIDVSKDVDLDVAVRKFESVMAPTNYRRPNPIISKKMIEDAKRTIAELGLTESLARHFATADEVPVGNVLYVNRNKTSNDIFGVLKEDIAVNPRSLTKVREVTLQDFIEKVLPTSRTVRLLLENQHESNLVSLIAPDNMDAPSLLKWDNGFSWSYNNDVADSLREKVKRAGGKTEGMLRASLGWFTYTDLDLHLIEPDGDHIYFGNRHSDVGGELDVDMNAGGRMSPTPVENIIYPFGSRMKEGRYKVYVHNFTDRAPTNEFTVELECEGQVYTYHHAKRIPNGDKITAFEFTYSRKDGFKVNSTAEAKISSKEIWGLKTNRFHNVTTVMFSPNHWDEPGIGNKHVFFMLEGCKNPNGARGIFNEFIKEELHRNHKRVFEALAGKMKVEPAEQQLSGLGFSTTTEGSFYCEVEGSFTRTLKVKV